MTRAMVELAVERACADHAEPGTTDVLLRALDDAFKPQPPRPLIMSQWLFDWLTGVYAGKPIYLARLRADLNERRRREALPTLDPNAFWGVDRSVQS